MAPFIFLTETLLLLLHMPPASVSYFEYTNRYYQFSTSLVSKNSPVFKTMFTLPAVDANETYDGVPLVWLPDTAEEVESLILRILYHET